MGAASCWRIFVAIEHFFGVLNEKTQLDLVLMALVGWRSCLPDIICKTELGLQSQGGMIH